MILLGIYFVLVDFGNSISEYYSVCWVSKSISESKTKGVFVRELNISPKMIEKYWRKIRFNECWIEKQTRLQHSFLFFDKYQATGKYRLCFNLKEKFPDRNGLSYFFINQNGESFTINSSGNSEVFNSFIDKNRKEKVEVNFVKSFQEPKDKIAIIDLK